ncbi:sulfatase [Thalassoglobus sp. JC818]|uniref:sulfatase family protein n=1 Tax=Thalassoglobus sp. JC818 TaxID=3232136 RepID=UPI003459EE88
MRISSACFLFFLLSLALSCAPAQSADRPNILWIVGENLAHDLGCYGQENVETPNLDGLAERGVMFTNVIATSPVCAPSRSALMTGMYQTTTDMHNMRSHRDDDFRLPAGVRPLTHRLKDAGYVTANITTMADKTVGTGKLDLNFVNEGPVYDTDDWGSLARQQPFFAQINMPEIEYDIYDRKSAEKERVVWVGEEWHPQIATADNVNPPSYYPDHPVVREEWARYLNSVSGMDVRIGWILEQLERDGLSDNTIILFFGDNGRLEARGIHWCFDSGLRVPLIVYWPEKLNPPEDIVPGTDQSQPISLLDVTATTLAIAGVERPWGMQSRVFLGPQADSPRSYVFAARDRIDETVITQRSVHDGRFHYIRNFTPGAGFSTLNRYKEKCFLVKPLMRQLQSEGQLEGPPADLMQPFPEEMLFDLESDPEELKNLAANPEYKEPLLRMRAALETWIVESNDRGMQLEPHSVVEPFVKEMHDWFGTPDGLDSIHQSPVFDVPEN